MWVQTVQWKDIKESQRKVGGSSEVERPSLFTKLDGLKELVVTTKFVVNLQKLIFDMQAWQSK